MDFRTYLRAIQRSWWLIALIAVLGGGAGYAVAATSTPVYRSEVTWFVSTPSTTAGTPLQADQFVQARINSYLLAMKTDKFAQQVKTASGVDLSIGQIVSAMSAASQVDSVVIAATVDDSVPARSESMARAIAEEFGPFVQSLDVRDKSGEAPVTLRVISGPTLDTSPVSPRPTVDTGIGVLAGLLLGLGIAVLRQRRDRSVDSAETLRTVSGLPVLASTAFDKTAGQQPVVTSAQLMRSRRAESYRQLRTNIQFVGMDNPAQVIVVTSPVAGDGRTTTAANLAVVHAESGLRVVLVEADLRTPALSGLLGLSGDVGLTDVLTGRAPVARALQQWTAGGFSVLTAGTATDRPSELLLGDRMRELVAELRTRFDAVIVDVPPVNAVTDAVVASTWADGVLLVVRAGRTARDEVTTARQWLATAGAVVLGTVLNARPGGSGDKVSGYGTAYYDAPPIPVPVTPGDRKVRSTR